MTGWIDWAAGGMAGAVAARVGDGVLVAAAAVELEEVRVAVAPEGAGVGWRFEIGSVTKTVTATVLALLVGEGVVRLEDPVGRWLAAGDNGGITVGELATHTSGLPRVGANVDVGAADPWAGYGFEQAEEGLRRAAPAAGNPWRYSNLGYQLLGRVVEVAGGRPYGELVTERVLGPLGMSGSRVGARDDGLLAGRAWAHPLGAGGVEATIGDLARYAKACLVPPEGSLGAAVRLAQEPVLRVDDETEQALGWVVRGGTLREHSGATAGFTACVAVDPGRGRAAALLAARGGSLALASHLRRAARLALAGEDPSAVELPAPYPEWPARAVELARALLAHDFATAHALIDPARQGRTTPDRLERAWSTSTAQANQAAQASETAQADQTARVNPAEVTVLGGEVAASGAVMVDLEIPFERAVRRLRVVVLPTGTIAGMALRPPTSR